MPQSQKFPQFNCSLLGQFLLPLLPCFSVSLFFWGGNYFKQYNSNLTQHHYSSESYAKYCCMGTFLVHFWCRFLCLYLSSVYLYTVVKSAFTETVLCLMVVPGQPWSRIRLSPCVVLWHLLVKPYGGEINKLWYRKDRYQVTIFSAITRCWNW